MGKDIADIQREAMLKVMEERGLNPFSWSSKASISPSAFRDFMSGKTFDMRMATFIALAKAAEVPVSVLIGEESFDAAKHAKLDDADFVWINIYDTSLSAGNGFCLTEDAAIVDKQAYRRSWLKGRTNARDDQLFVMKISGDSMIPDLFDGETALVDMSQTRPMNKIFALKQDGHLFAKKLALLPAGKIQIISTNTIYPPYEMTEDIQIIGRIINASRDL